MTRGNRLSAAQKKALRQLVTYGNFANMRGELRPYNSTITALRKMGLIELDESIRIWFAYQLTAAGRELAASLFSEASTPAPTVHAGYWHGYCKGCGYKTSIRNGYCDNCTPPTPTKTTRFQQTGGGKIISGHNRGKKRTQSRKDSQKPRFKAHKVSFTMNGANIEKNTPQAQMWQQKHHLVNAVAMPVPTITGAQLLQQAGLTLLPPTVSRAQPKRLTRMLERAA